MLNQLFIVAIKPFDSDGSIGKSFYNITCNYGNAK